MTDKKEVFDYLVALRDSGVVNMFSAGRYIENAFNVPRKEASALLAEWIESFSKADK